MGLGRRRDRGDVHQVHRGTGHGALVHRCNADTCAPSIPMLLPLSFFLLTSGRHVYPVPASRILLRLFTVLVNFESESVSCVAIR